MIFACSFCGEFYIRLEDDKKDKKRMKMEMTIYQLVVLLFIGFFAGMLSGFVGVGGGLIIVPALVYFLGFGQFEAQGTSLAVLLLPVGILAVMQYYKAGHINMNFALVIALAFIVGSLVGSKGALALPPHKVKFVFGLFMIYAAIRITWSSGVEWFGNK